MRELRPADPRGLGSYEIVGRLGQGGMGSVFLANSAEGRAVAIKVIRAELAGDAEFRRRFRQEVARAQEVPPFCTAEVLDADTEHEPPYLVVEYVDGPSLSDVVVERGPLTPANLHGIALGVAVALTAIHGAGVIHRDLKPSNVLLAPGSPKVIDFGIARAAAGNQFDTRTDEVVGTVSYMAPERFGPGASQSLTPAADVFAWGTIVAFAATGRTPFAAESQGEVAARIMTQPPNLDGLTGPLRALVDRALAKDPADRPTARELVDSLLAGSDRLAAGPAAFVEQPEVLAAAGIATVGDMTTVVAGNSQNLGIPGFADANTQIVGAGPIHRPPQPRLIGPPPGFRPTGPAPRPHRNGPGPEPRPVRPAPKPASGSKGIRTALVVLSVAVVLLAGAMVAIWQGGLGAQLTGNSSPSATVIPGALVDPTSPPVTPTPTPTPETTPSAGPSTTASPSRGDTAQSSVAPGAVSLIAGSFGNWESKVDAVNQATCASGSSELTVTSGSSTTRGYRCKGPTDVLTDFTVTVDVTLSDANSCGGVWFHFAASSGGYALMVCPDRYELITHVGASATTVIRLFTDKRAGPATVIRVGIQAKGNRVWFYRNNDVSAEITAHQFASGIVALGVFPASVTAEPPFAVTFTNVHLWQAPPA